MMGARTVMQEALFYSFSLEDHVPQSHLLRAVDRFVDLSGIRRSYGHSIAICQNFTAFEQTAEDQNTVFRYDTQQSKGAEA